MDCALGSASRRTGDRVVFTPQAVTDEGAPDMSQAKKGDTVKVHYTGWLADGTQFDSSLSQDPLEFLLGAGHVIRGFDRAIVGMQLGETKKVDVPCDLAYGPRNDGQVRRFERDQIPGDVDLAVGRRFNVSDGQGVSAAVTITELSDTHVTLDANHPLAGQDLTFEIVLVAIG